MPDLTKETPLELATLLKSELVRCGFSEAALRGALVTPFPAVFVAPHPKWLKPDAVAHLPTPIAQLARLFLLGETITAFDLFPTALMDLLVEWSFITFEQGRLTAEVMIVPWEDLHIVCDRYDRRLDYRHVFIPNHSTRLVELFLKPTSAPVLDVGTGPGTLASVAAKASRNVEAIDVSSRAIAFARFNRALNRTFFEARIDDLAALAPPSESLGLILCNVPAHGGKREHLAHAFAHSRAADLFISSLIRVASDCLTAQGVCVLGHDLLLDSEPTTYFRSVGNEQLSGVRVDLEFLPFLTYERYRRCFSLLVRSHEAKVIPIAVTDDEAARALATGDPFAAIIRTIGDRADALGAPPAILSYLNSEP